MNQYIYMGTKRHQYYKGILIKADLHLHEQITDKLISLLPSGGHILDLGAGEGALSQRLIDNHFSVVASDMNQKDFKCKQAEFYQLNFHDSKSISQFQSKYNESFDAVLGIEVIEHLENQWEYIRFLKSLLKPQGYLIVTTPNTTSWLSRVKFFFTGRFHQFDEQDLAYGHISPITQWELEHILKQEGFIDITTCSAGTLPPIYITRSFRLIFSNLFSLCFRLFMSGIKDGWCILIVGRKP